MNVIRLTLSISHTGHQNEKRSLKYCLSSNDREIVKLDEGSWANILNCPRRNEGSCTDSELLLARHHLHTEVKQRAPKRDSF